MRDEPAERDVVVPPAWAGETFGERPDNTGTSAQWDRGVRAVARYRVEHDVADEILGLGPEPADQHGRHAWHGRRVHLGAPRPQPRRRAAPRPRRRPPEMSRGAAVAGTVPPGL